MADLVDGDGWISDESSFYGDERTVRALEKKSKRKLDLPHQFPVKRLKAKKEDASHSGQPAKSKDDVLSFLKSRPQIRKLQKAPTTGEAARTGAGNSEGERREDTRFEGNPAAWQHHETIDDFIKRAPPTDPKSASLGPWLWVGNPNPLRSHLKGDTVADVETFKEAGEQLLETFSAERAKLERSMPNVAPATITKKLASPKFRLEQDLFALAAKTSVTSGKWMLFPTDEDYPRCWRLVAEATAAGKLGMQSKTGTIDPTSPGNLICIYTYDFDDGADVRRVLEALVDLELCSSNRKSIYYKCDAYTYLDIKSNNEYKLRASLYSSKEMLPKEVKPMDDDPIAGVKGKNHALDSFFEF